MKNFNFLFRNPLLRKLKQEAAIFLPWHCFNLRMLRTILICTFPQCEPCSKTGNEFRLVGYVGTVTAKFVGGFDPVRTKILHLNAENTVSTKGKDKCITNESTNAKTSRQFHGGSKLAYVCTYFRVFLGAPSGRLWEAPGLRWAEFLCKNFEFFRGKSSFFPCFE